MPLAEWLKTKCEYCDYIFDKNDDRIIITRCEKNGGYPKHHVLGHYCEKCFEKISGIGKRD